MTASVLDAPKLARQYEDLSDKQFNHGKRLIADLAIRPGEAVLDVGSGAGRLAEHVADLVGPQGVVVGVDPLPLRVAIAERKARANLSFAVAAAEDLSRFADASFDAVFFNSVLDWIENQPAALAEAARVLKPGGRIGIAAASKERPHSLQALLREVAGQPPFSQYGGKGLDRPPFKLDLTETIALLDAAGFRATSAEIKTFSDYFDSAQAVIDFRLSSACGNCLRKLPEDARRQAVDAIAARLESLRGPRGIELRRNLVFSVAVKR